MKKILALALALLMALGCVCAQAEDGLLSLEGSMQISSSGLNTILAFSGTEMDEATSAAMDTILSIINALTVNCLIGDDGLQAEIRLNNKAVATLAAATDETGDGIVIVSDMLPTYAVTAQEETLYTLLDSVSSSVSYLEGVEAFVEAYMEQSTVLSSFVEEKMGDPVFGEYTIESATFNMMIPFQLTVGDCVQMGVEMVKGVLADEDVKEFLLAQGATEENLNSLALDDVLSEMDAEKAAIPVNMNAYVQVSEDGYTGDNVYFTVECVMDGTTESFAFGAVDGAVYLRVLMGEETYKTEEELRQAAQMGVGEACTVDMVLALGEDAIGVAMEMVVQGMYVGVSVEGRTEDDEVQVQAALYLLDNQTPMLILSGKVGYEAGEMTLPVSTEGKTILSLEEMLADSEGTALASLSDDLQNLGLIKLLSNAMDAMPDEITLLFNMMTGVESDSVAE